MINVLDFNYNEMSKKINEIEELTNYLIKEYNEKTYTTKLSREDISNIAEKLPERKNWGKDEFEQIKKEIMEEYDIGSRDFSKALNIIKAHREFCTKIGLEKPIVHLNTESLIKYININKALNNNAKDTNGQLKSQTSYFKKKEDYIKKLQSEISKESIICIATLKKLSVNFFSEAFDRLYNETMEEADYQGLCRRIMDESVLRLVEISLVKMGQKTLLDVFLKNR